MVEATSVSRSGTERTEAVVEVVVDVVVGVDVVVDRAGLETRKDGGGGQRGHRWDNNNNNKHGDEME